MVGECLGALNLRELKNLEGKVEKAISKIRAKKVTEKKSVGVSLIHSSKI